MSDFSVKAAQPNTLQINCERIVLTQKSLELEIDITNALENIDTIIVNGITFVRPESKVKFHLRSDRSADWPDREWPLHTGEHSQ